MDTIFVLGPTAVGKSEAAEKIAHKIDGEIINMDMGQLLEPISIGTAKPLGWKENSIKHHLFDVIKEPVPFSVVTYREKVVETVKSIQERGKKAIFVGGSLFYLQYLLFALHQEPEPEQENSLFKINNKLSNTEYSWEYLNKIDPERAAAIHPNDKYRIKRAITIWRLTGQKPSSKKPCWDPVVPKMSLLWLFREKKDLQTRIRNRVELMIQQGWKQEVEMLTADWKKFVHKKKLCGHNIVVDACDAKKKELDNEDKEHIIRDTMQYAKRQRVFWDFLKKKHLADYAKVVSIIEMNLTFHSFDLYLEKIVSSERL